MRSMPWFLNQIQRDPEKLGDQKSATDSVAAAFRTPLIATDVAGRGLDVQARELDLSATVDMKHGPSMKKYQQSWCGC